MLNTNKLVCLSLKQILEEFTTKKKYTLKRIKRLKKEILKTSTLKYKSLIAYRRIRNIQLCKSEYKLEVKDINL